MVVRAAASIGVTEITGRSSNVTAASRGGVPEGADRVTQRRSVPSEKKTCHPLARGATLLRLGDREEQQAELGGNVDRWCGRPSWNLGRPLEGYLPAGPQLLQGIDGAGEVDGQQHRVQGHGAEHLWWSIAVVLEIAPEHEQVGEERDQRGGGPGRVKRPEHQGQ